MMMDRTPAGFSGVSLCWEAVSICQRLRPADLATVATAADKSRETKQRDRPVPEWPSGL
jgi:hypothetical protein